ERPRIDDLALTLYYANSTWWHDPLSDSRIHQLRRLVDSYGSGLDEHLTTIERTALPLALARAPLALVGMTASLDTEERARQHASGMMWDVGWALAIVRGIERWQRGFAGS